MTESVETLCQTAAVVGGVAAGSSGIIQTLIAGSLSQLWGMINPLQILVHTRLFNVKFPSNASLITSSIITVATFDIPYVNVDAILGKVTLLSKKEEIDKPDVFHDDSASVAELKGGLEELGYGSRFIGRTMGSIYIFIIITTGGLLLMMCLMPIKTKS